MGGLEGIGGRGAFGLVSGRVGRDGSVERALRELGVGGGGVRVYLCGMAIPCDLPLPLYLNVKLCFSLVD